MRATSLLLKHKTRFSIPFVLAPALLLCSHTSRLQMRAFFCFANRKKTLFSQTKITRVNRNHKRNTQSLCEDKNAPMRRSWLNANRNLIVDATTRTFMLPKKRSTETIKKQYARPLIRATHHLRMLADRRTVRFLRNTKTNKNHFGDYEKSNARPE
jgi:hypothetical protein